MPAFRGLSEGERQQVLAYLKMLTPGMTSVRAVSMVVPDQPIPMSSGSVARGKEVYRALECGTCHGEEGDGRAVVGLELTGEQGLPLRATDFRYRTEFRNGASPRDVLRSLWTGLDGTPMPSFAVQFEGQEADAWHLVNYLLSLAR